MKEIKIKIDNDKIDNYEEISKIVIYTKNGKYFECDDYHIQNHTLEIRYFRQSLLFACNNIDEQLRDSESYKNITIDFSTSYLNDNCINFLVDVLNRYENILVETLTSMDLSHNYITVHGIKNVLELLNRCKKLQIFKCDINYMTDNDYLVVVEPYANLHKFSYAAY